MISESVPLLRRINDTLIFGLDRVEQLRKLPDVMRAEDKIHKAIFLLNPEHLVLFLHHAAANPDQHIRIQFFEMLHDTEMPVELLVGIFPHRAGIKEENVGVFGRNLLTADFRENAGELLRVARIHLAPHRRDVVAHGTAEPLLLFFYRIL